MLRAAFYEVRAWVVLTRRRLTLYWLLRERGDFAFIAALGIPFAVVGFIVYFAYAARETIDGSRTDTARRRTKDIRCLAENIYFEARGEPLQGQYAVAEVTMNRLASPYFPDTLCEVVHDTRWDASRRRLVAHFSWTAFKLRLESGSPEWQQAMDVATLVYDGHNQPVVPDALFYHATSVQPYWASSKRVVAKIGNHIFYR
ncbi:cell wall hydrolase [Steroidobacter sp.]|uniref:cell wall hydrolase n=1 Tax=Steroidobacter sp. TaxID=1978227 RepID=UPI001A52F1F9|nr:cell wall hydrolase [Steroidobacter sp.]MBL8269732.1 cell wall hydrolase [Steroidobacter sp.]